MLGHGPSCMCSWLTSLHPKMSNLRDQQSELSFQLQNGLLLSRQKSLEEARGEEEKPDKQIHTKLRLLPTLEASSTPLKRSDLRHQAFFIGQIVLLVVVVVQFIMLYRTCILAAAGVANAGLMKKQASSSSSSRPDYYQTSPELWPGTKCHSGHRQRNAF